MQSENYGSLKHYYLINVARVAAEHPVTFCIPDRQELDAIEIGQNVKLFFSSRIPSFPVERMWVKIIDIGPTYITGVLQNDPITFALSLHHGSILTFKKYHIASTEVPPCYVN